MWLICLGVKAFDLQLTVVSSNPRNMATFQVFSMAAAAIVGFKIFKFLTVGRSRGTISTNLTKVSTTDHSGSSGILLILLSIVVPEKLPGQKRCDEEAEEEHEFLGVIDVFLQ